MQNAGKHGLVQSKGLRVLLVLSFREPLPTITLELNSNLTHSLSVNWNSTGTQTNRFLDAILRQEVDFFRLPIERLLIYSVVVFSLFQEQYSSHIDPSPVHQIRYQHDDTWKTAKANIQCTIHLQQQNQQTNNTSRSPRKQCLTSSNQLQSNEHSRHKSPGNQKRHVCWV